jgi:hypothetical protein
MPNASIHYQRRWYYALWVVLLLASATALVLWERPLRVDRATLCLNLTMHGAPEGTRVQAWAGPSANWPGQRWTGGDAFASLPLTATGRVQLPPVALHISRRRWGPGTIPRGTWDLVMVRYLPPQGPARYFAVSCAKDIRMGLLRPGLKLLEEIDGSWDNLQVDAEASLRVP